ncbi:MAG: ABC transporter transmembrane domain-containing protein, partial [Acidobacteriota bacterium]
MFKCEFFNTTLTAVDEYNRLSEKADRHKVVIGDSLGDLASILGSKRGTVIRSDLDNPLFAACVAIGQAQEINFQPPPRMKRDQEAPQDLLGEILKASRVRHRNVVLKHSWWKKDQGPMLAYWKESNGPVALLPASSHSYTLYDPAKKTRMPVTEGINAELSATAVTFYRPFETRMISGWDMLKFGLAGTGLDMWRVLFMAVATSLLALVVPIATGYIFDTVIPQAEKVLLLQITLVLFTITIATVIFQISQSIAVLRIEGKFDPVANAAIMDRLLNLPVPFFRNYSAGDLAMRANGIAEIRKLLSGTVLTSLLTGIFSLFNFILLFYYDWKLALIGLGVITVAVLYIIATGFLQMKDSRKLKAIEGKISGIVFQIITGISKLRVAGAEGYAFAYWASKFAEQRRLAFETRMVLNRLSVFNSVLPIGASLAIFAWISFGSNRLEILTGDFLAFNAAFSQFLVAIVSMSTSVLLIVSLIPSYERIEPILHALPEA